MYQVYIYTRMMHTYILTYIRTYIHEYIRIHFRMCTYLHIRCIYIYMHMFTYPYVYIHIDMDTDMDVYMDVERVRHAPEQTPHSKEFGSPCRTAPNPF